MILIATLTTSLVTNSGQSTWFVGGLIFATTLFLLPPRSQQNIPSVETWPTILLTTPVSDEAIKSSKRVLEPQGCLADKGRNLMTYQAVRKATEPEKAQQLIAGALPPLVASILQPAELEIMRQRLIQLPEPPKRARLGKTDWLGALAVFLLVFLSTFPVAIPFLFMQHAAPALRASNAIAIVMLFLLGYAFGRRAGRNSWVIGISMVILGAGLVALAKSLGG